SPSPSFSASWAAPSPPGAPPASSPPPPSAGCKRRRKGYDPFHPLLRVAITTGGKGATLIDDRRRIVPVTICRGRCDGGMAKDFTPYQQKVIRNYYANKEAIQGQSLADLVSDLYLAGTEKKKAALWERARKLMAGLGVADAVANAISEKRNLA